MFYSNGQNAGTASYPINIQNINECIAKNDVKKKKTHFDRINFIANEQSKKNLAEIYKSNSNN